MNLYHDIIISDYIEDGIYNATIQDGHEGITKDGKIYFILLYNVISEKYIKQYIYDINYAKRMMAICKLPVANSYDFPYCLINQNLNIRIKNNKVINVYRTNQ